MNKRSGALAVALLALAISGCAEPAASQGRTGTATSSPASAAPATSSAPVTSSTPAEVKLGTTADAVAAGWLAGTPQPTFPAGPNGKVAVVASGPILVDAVQAVAVPVALRNGSQDTITSIDITGAAMDASGKILGSGNSLEFSPTTVPAGGVALGFVYFESVIPADAKIEFTVASKPLKGKPNSRDLTVNQANAVGATITGKATNNHSYTVKGTFSVNVTCFDQTGALLASQVGSASPDADLAPGQSVTFQVQLHGKPCPDFLVGVSGSPY